VAITTVDGIVNALGNNARVAIIGKTSIATQLAGGFSSLWKAGGTPAAGANPTTAAIPTKATTGSLFNFTNATPPDKVYIARSFIVSGNSGTDVWIHDRLAHMGGLSGTVTTAQTVGASVVSLVGTRCAADYQNVQWWIEIYADIGTTAVTATVTYTNAAGTPGQTTTVTIGGASPANQDSRMFPIYGSGGEDIQSIQTIQHATTGTAGNYGITATRPLTTISLGLANNGEVYDWAQLGFPEVPNDACLMGIVVCGTTSTGTLNGSLKLVTG
jgi:hypothetical protein